MPLVLMLVGHLCTVAGAKIQPLAHFQARDCDILGCAKEVAEDVGGVLGTSCLTAVESLGSSNTNFTAVADCYEDIKYGLECSVSGDLPQDCAVCFNITAPTGGSAPSSCNGPGGPPYGCNLTSCADAVGTQVQSCYTALNSRDFSDIVDCYEDIKTDVECGLFGQIPQECGPCFNATEPATNGQCGATSTASATSASSTSSSGGPRAYSLQQQSGVAGVVVTVVTLTLLLIH